MTNLLEIKKLNVEFDADEGRILAVKNLSLSLKEGEVLGIVGESGSGKSVTAKSIMQLNPGNTHYEDGGEIIIDDENVLKFDCMCVWWLKFISIKNLILISFLFILNFSFLTFIFL